MNDAVLKSIIDEEKSWAKGLQTASGLSAEAVHSPKTQAAQQRRGHNPQGTPALDTSIGGKLDKLKRTWHQASLRIHFYFFSMTSRLTKTWLKLRSKVMPVILKRGMMKTFIVTASFPPSQVSWTDKLSWIFWTSWHFWFRWELKKYPGKQEHSGNIKVLSQCHMGHFQPC